MTAPTITADTGYTGTWNAVEVIYERPTRAEQARLDSNRFADEAMQMGLRGYEITAQRCALLADVYAQLSAIYEVIDRA